MYHYSLQYYLISYSTKQLVHRSLKISFIYICLPIYMHTQRHLCISIPTLTLTSYYYSYRMQCECVLCIVYTVYTLYYENKLFLINTYHFIIFYNYMIYFIIILVNINNIIITSRPV